MQKQKFGFTIVELLIVIVVIGILAALVLNSFAGAQQKARAAQIADTMKKIENGFQAQMISDGRTAWWPETDFNTCAGRTISSTGTTVNTHHEITSMRTNCSLTYLPAPDQSGPILYGYDNDNDTHPNDCTAPSAGVNILVVGSGMSNELFKLVSEVLDGDANNCGNVRYSSGQNAMFYNIAASPDEI